MSYDPGDYDEVYETTSEPEQERLTANGWVLLETREATVTAAPEEHRSFFGQWFGTAAQSGRTGRTSGEGFRGSSGAARNTIRVPEPEATATSATFVLGWPKGQQTISEAEYEEERVAAAVCEEPSAVTGDADVPEAPSPPPAPESPEGI